MPWKQLICTGLQNDIDELEAVLEEAGAEAISLEDAADAPLFEPIPGETPLWPTATVKALFAEDADLTNLLIQLQTQFPAVEVLSLGMIADQPWERAWLDHFHPIDFGHGLWIAPHGHEVPASAQTVIRLDPGLAFGTGTHSTTALCLRWIAAHSQLTDKTVVDFGCGSGILAIAALKRGARFAHAIDYDSQALTATLANAKENDVEALMACYTDAATERITGDIVFANILASTLLQLRPQLTAVCRPGGWLIMSGVLAYQVEPLVDAYSADFDIISIEEEDEWVRIDACKRKPVV